MNLRSKEKICGKIRPNERLDFEKFFPHILKTFSFNFLGIYRRLSEQFPLKKSMRNILNLDLQIENKKKIDFIGTNIPVTVNTAID